MASDFEKILLKLDCNDKKIFDLIEICADVNKSEANDIVQIIINRVKGDDKDILLLYAIDCIMKSVGQMYIVLFNDVIVRIFKKNFMSAGIDVKKKCLI